LKNLEKVTTGKLREELLNIKGVGHETADSILLYALHRPVFVIDAYTKRIFSRHHLIKNEADYHQVQQLFESGLPLDIKLFNEYHALLVRLGKTFCRPEALCDLCPLNFHSHDKSL